MPLSLLDLILLVVAALCFAWAAFATTQPRVGLVPLGLLAWVLVPLLGAMQGLG